MILGSGPRVRGRKVRMGSGPRVWEEESWGVAKWFRGRRRCRVLFQGLGVVEKLEGDPRV